MPYQKVKNPTPLLHIPQYSTVEVGGLPWQNYVQVPPMFGISLDNVICLGKRLVNNLKWDDEVYGIQFKNTSY